MGAIGEDHNSQQDRVESLTKHLKRYRKYMLLCYESIGYIEKNISEKIHITEAAPGDYNVGDVEDITEGIAESARDFFHYACRCMDLISKILVASPSISEEGRKVFEELDNHEYNQYAHVLKESSRCSATIPVEFKGRSAYEDGELFAIKGCQYQSINYGEKPLLEICTRVKEFVLETTDALLEVETGPFRQS